MFEVECIKLERIRKGIKNEKIIKLMMIGVLSASLITGCGGSGNTGDSQQAAQESTQENS